MTNKIKIAIEGSLSTPKLFTALQLAHGLTGAWERIIVIGSTSRDGQYQHIGGYSTLHVASDATPQRYTELLNIAASCKDAVILSGLSNEWQHGVSAHLQGSYYEDVLRAHRTFFHMLRHAPVHVIALVDTRTTFLQRDSRGRRKLRQERVIQQPGISQHFATVLRINSSGNARVEKDATKTLPTDEQFKVSLHHGALLSEWCRRGDPVISRELQERIDQCSSLGELYQLLFTMDVDDTDVITAFTRRRLQLDGDHKEHTMEIVPGGLWL
jgi:hypothetical protein